MAFILQHLREGQVDLHLRALSKMRVETVLNQAIHTLYEEGAGNQVQRAHNLCFHGLKSK